MDAQVSDSLKINQLHYLSSHNSYRKHTDVKIWNFINSLASLLPIDLLSDLDYTHDDIYTQLQRYGVRHIELDIYGDQEGGRFYHRAGYKFTGRHTASHVDELLQPGLKVLHIPDIDFETHYHTFVQALEEVKRWSDDYPNHLPVFVLIETKTLSAGDFLSFAGFVKAEPWDEQALSQIEKEILQVFSYNDIIKPDDVRGEYSTLREAVLEKGWPTIGESRGKVMFMFDQSEITKKYKGEHLSLEGKLIFTNAKPNAPDAAFIKMNDPNDSKIKKLVQQGFLIRSMVGGVQENKTNSYSKFETAKRKGVHFLSTDYYRPDARVRTSKVWTDFTIRLKNHSYEINEVTN